MTTPVVNALRSRTNPKGFYPVEGWLADAEGLVGRTRFVNDLQIVRMSSRPGTTLVPWLRQS